jgi:transcriptional regulator with XRE-family HTH domain
LGIPIDFAEFLQMVKHSAFCMAGNLHVADHQPVSDTLHRTEVGRRLRAAIEALGLTLTAVGKTLDTSPSKMGNWLRGDSYPSEWFIKQFCDRYGITTDWIYRGIVSGMPAELANALWKSEQSAHSDARPMRADPPTVAPTKPKGPEPPPGPPEGGRVEENEVCRESGNVLPLKRRRARVPA